MKKQSTLLLVTMLMIVSSCMQNAPDNTAHADNGSGADSTTIQQFGSLTFVKGGAYRNTKSALYGTRAIVPDFYIGQNEVTQKEWTDVMGSNPSQFQGEDLPVEMVSWYDCIEYCNRRSVREGLEPFYNIDHQKKDPNNKCELDSIKWVVTINAGANGYRLPTEAEWEYAAGGGQVSKSFAYSGSDNIDEVAWYFRNSGDSILRGEWLWRTVENNHCRTNRAGSKKANELGLFDMSGNVREWCEEWYQDFDVSPGVLRVQRGGGWMGSEYRCESAVRDNFEPNGKGPDQGFRLCRSKVM